MSVPDAVAAVDGRFLACAGDGAPIATPDAPPPPSLPTILPGEPAPIAPPAPAAQRRPTTVFLTVDTEDAYFTRPHLMTGEGIGREYGVHGILDLLGQRDLPATFFVNVFEADRQPPGAVCDVVRQIAGHGHEVALHTHPAPHLEWYDRPLFRKTREQQADVLRRGCDLLASWTGQEVRTFRAGGYAIDDRTFEALADTGLTVDSSVFFPSPNNHNAPFTVNAVRERGDVVEVPVTCVLRGAPDGPALDARKLDLDWLSPPELDAALDALTARAVPFAVFMMHSFSFIEKASLPPGTAPSPRARFTSEVLFNRFVEIYGPRAGAREGFAAFLDRIAADPRLRAQRLDTAEADLRAVARRMADVVPVVARRAAP